MGAWGSGRGRPGWGRPQLKGCPEGAPHWLSCSPGRVPRSPQSRAVGRGCGGPRPLLLLSFDWLQSGPTRLLADFTALGQHLLGARLRGCPRERNGLCACVVGRGGSLHPASPAMGQFSPPTPQFPCKFNETRLPCSPGAVPTQPPVAQQRPSPAEKLGSASSSHLRRGLFSHAAPRRSWPGFTGAQEALFRSLCPWGPRMGKGGACSPLAA